MDSETDTYRGKTRGRHGENTICGAKEHLRPPEAQRKAGDRFSLLVLRKNQHNQCLDLSFLASRTIKQKFLLSKPIEQPDLFFDCFSSPSKLIYQTFLKSRSTIFRRDNIFQGMLGVTGLLTETGEGPSSMSQQAWVKAASPADEEGTWDIQLQTSCAAELRAGGDGASLHGPQR